MLKSIILFFLLSSATVSSQTCEGYFPINKGAIMETTSYNEKGKPQSTVTVIIKDVERKVDGIKLIIHSDIADEKGKPISSADYDALCANGVFSINIKSMLSGDQLKAWKDMTVSMEAEDIAYPVESTVGQVLKDAHLKVSISMSGMNLPGTSIDITNRKIEAKESITTPAGTFDCIKITSDVKVKNIVSFETKTAEWLSIGNGVIRTESYKGEKMKTYSILTKLVK